MKLEIIAATTFGLEAVAKREIEALGYKILRAEDGKITFTVKPYEIKTIRIR